MKEMAIKKYTLALCLSWFSFLAHAQQIKWGLKGGINFSNVNGNAFSTDTTSALLGYHAGVFCTIKLPLISIQPELLVSTAGATLRGNSQGQRLKLTYVSMPIMLQVKILPATYLEAGPQFSFKMGEDISNNSFSGFIENLDVAAGGGIRFKVLFLSAYARYMAGISKVGNLSTTSSPNFKNSWTQAGFCLHLKSKRK
ncbi:MAG: hypothetical protein RL115_1066 [Bacteroidota bacterium]|jgi:hypothetical protein